MISISIIGLDHFVVGQYSRENGENLAQLFETDEDNVSFVSTDSVILHDGVEQTSWNVLVQIHAPHKYEAMEKEVAHYLLRTLAPFAINIEVEFVYFHDHSHYEAINKQYPRFIRSENIHEVVTEEEFESEESEEERDHECECGHHHDHDCDCEEGHCHCHDEEEEEVYLGNAFAGFDEKLAELEKNK